MFSPGFIPLLRLGIQKVFMMEKTKQKNYILLHVLLLFLSFSGVFSKMAAGHDFLSLGFILCYGGVLLILFLYAILWQQVLKRIPLTIAYCNKSVTIIWGMIVGALIFGESITVQNIIGACIVFVGVYLMVTADE